MIELTRYVVEEWIKTMATGDFHYKEVLDGTVRPAKYGNLRKIMFDICHSEKPICESIGRRDGWYRAIQEMLELVNWQGVDANKDFPVILPFGLRKYVWIDPNTCGIVAGSKDSGKSGFLMRTVVLNMLNMNVVFLSNMEGGASQVKRRFDAMDIEIPNPAPFKMYHMIDNFHDAITESDTLYIIDYIDVPDTGEYFMIAPAVAKIQAKVGGLDSFAMIGLQKKVNSNIAYGGEPTLKKATLYLAIDKNKLKIVSAKIHTDPKIDPVNMQWTFQYSEEGTNFINIQRSYGN